MNRFPSWRAVSAVTALLLLSSILLRAEQAQAPGKPLDAADMKFLILASQDGETEMKLGALAMDSGTSQGVKALGSMMANDHGKANAELKALCTRRGVQLPAALDPDHQKVVDTIAKLKGPEFDSAYVDQVVAAHKAAVAEFEGASRKTKDADVKSFTETILPILRHHLKEAEALKVATTK